jgi:hypothetical protein
MRVSVLVYVFYAALLGSVCAAAQNGPLSLDRFGQHQKLYMLDESGKIVVSEQRQIDAPTRVLTRVPPNLKALDILSTKLWINQELVFVTAYGLTTEDSRPRLIQYSATGELQCEWILPEVSAGLDVDRDNHVVYLSGSSTGTIYGLKLLKDTCYGSQQLKPVTQIKAARRLGPIVIDPTRRLAFVADILKGAVFRLDLDRGGALEIVDSLGQPAALLYNDSQNLMYLADAAGRRIFRIDVDRLPVPRPILISKDPALQEPSSLAFAADGKLLVGDRRAKVIFTLNLSGQIQSQFTTP